jgi:hypothetical protein
LTLRSKERPFGAILAAKTLVGIIPPKGTLPNEFSFQMAQTRFPTG